MKRPTFTELMQQVADWNATYPIGTPVIRYKLINPLREPQDSKTRSEAWMMGGHSPMVIVEGVAGGVILESVVPKRPDSPPVTIPDFKLSRYNPRRAARGKEAAEVEVTYPDGESECLWMSIGDIRNNIHQWGESAGLTAALEAYKTNTEYPAKNE